MILDYLNNNEKELIKYLDVSDNKVLFHEDDKCFCVGIVVKGQVKISTFLNNGNEVIYNTLNVDQMFGNNLIFSNQPYYRGDVKADKGSRIALIYKDDLIKILKSNEEFLFAYLNIQSEFTKTLNSNIKLLSITNAKERLIYYLHINNNKIEFKTISELAKNLYLERETLSRTISKMIKDKLIYRDNNKIGLL